MKRILALVIVLSMILAAVPSMASDLFYGDIKVTLDGKNVEMKDVTGKVIEPFIKEGTTYLPIRALSNAFGFEVDWNQETKTVFVGKKVESELGENINIYIDGEKFIAKDVTGKEVYPINVEGSVYLPVRAIAEAFGKKVEWNQESLLVTITTPKAELGGKYYVITNVATGKKLAAVDFNRENNAQLVTVDAPVSDDVTWRLGKMGDMIFNLSNAASGKSIDVPGASKDVGKNVIMYSSNGNSNQSWQFEEVEEGVYMMKVRHSNLYLDASGDVLVQNEKNDSDAQKWTLEYVKDSMLNLVTESEGFKLVAPVLQDGFKRYMFGNLPACYTVANNAESYFIANDFENASAQLQAEMIKTVSSYTAYGQVTGDKQDRTSAEYEIVSKTVDDSYDIWRGSREKCWIYSVEMKGDVEGQLHKFIMVSNEEDSAMVTKMIEGLGSFPFAVRQHVKRLIWRKGDNANNYNGGGDTIWARLNFEPSANAVIQTLAHELGHVLDQKTLGDMRIWSWAEGMDAIPVSGYGSSNQAEDLAEMHRLYWTTLGKDTETAVEEVYPNRMKVLKALLYRADNVYYADFAVYEEFVKEILDQINAYGDMETAAKFEMNKYYKITDKETGLAWTIENASVDNTAKLILSEYTGADNQLFYVENFAGLIKLYNKNSQIPVQLHTSAMYNKPLTQYGGTWAVDEKLQMIEVEGGWKMMSRRYNLGVTAVTEGVEENFVPYVGQDAESDIWVIEAVGNREDVKNYTIKVEGKLLAGDNGLYFTETENNGTNWMLQAVGETFTIVNPSTGKAVDISGGSAQAGAKLIAYDLSKNDNQLFFMEKTDKEGEYFLKMKHSELYLTVNEDGTITQEEKDSTKAQLFVFEEIAE